MTTVTQQFGRPVSRATVESYVGGDVTGFHAVGENILQVGSVHGNVVVEREREPSIRRRPVPPGRAPVPFQGLLGRGDDVEAAAEALATGGPVEFHGESGVGKSVTIRHLAYLPGPVRRDGAIYCRGRRRDLTDILQYLFDAFYECVESYSPRPGEVATCLAPLEALVLVDDVELDLDALEELRQMLPRSHFLLTAKARCLWGEGLAVALDGLDDDAACALVERVLRRPLAPDEAADARRLSRMLSGNPRALLQALEPVERRRQTLAEVAAKLDVARPADTLAEELVVALSPEARDVLGVVAAFRGAPVHADLIAALTGLADVARVIGPLLEHGSIKSNSPVYSITIPVTDEVRTRIRPDDWEKRAITHFRAALERHRAEPDVFVNDVDAIFQLIEATAADGRYLDVIALTRAADPFLIAERRWGLWDRAVRWALDAARASGDRDAEGWCRHQLGTRAMCLGDLDLARSELTQAYAIRRSLGQRKSAEVTKYHLDQLSGPHGPPQPPDEPPPRVPPSPRRWGRAVMGTGVVLAVLTGFLLLLTRSAPAEPSGRHVEPGLVLEVTPVHVDFGERRLGVAGAERTVRITNQGPGTFASGSAATEGDAASEFAVGHDRCSARPLAAGSTCEIGVVFAPARVGSRSARLVVPGGEKLLTVALVGTGTSPGEPLTGVLEAAPTALDLGKANLGSTVGPKTVTVRNGGQAAVEVRTASVVGGNPEDFLVDAGACAGRSLPPRQSCRLELRFAPTATGDRRAILEVRADDGSTSVVMAGTGVAPSGPPQPGVVTVDPVELSFASQKVGTSSTRRAVTVANGGGQSATVPGASLSGPHPRDFALDTGGCAGVALAPSQTCVVSVSFAPTAKGSRSAQLEIGGRRVPLTGTGTQGNLVADRSGIDFTDTQFGDTTPASTVTLRNIGTADAVVDRVVVDDGAFVITANTCKSLRPEGSCTIDVRFSPPADRTYAGSLSIHHDVGDPLVLKLNGTGRPRTSVVLLRVQADLALTACYSGLRCDVAPGGFLVTITNSGTHTATGVRLGMTLAGGSVDGVTPSQGTCSRVGSRIDCDLGDQPVGTGITVRVAARPAGSMSFAAEASAAETDPDSKNNTASITVPG